MAVIETNGLSDSALYAQVMAGIRGAYENYGIGNGNYPNAEDMLTDRGLYNIWMKNMLDAKIYADGMGYISMTAQAAGVSSVRVPIMAPPPYSPRTITIQAYPGYNFPGTPGNSGLENKNLPDVPQGDGVEVVFNQIYDRATVIHKLSQNMVSLPIAAERTKLIPRAVANMEDSSLLATQLIGGLARAAATENSNIIPVDLTNITEGSLQQVMNKLIGTMTNPQTSWSEGIVQFDLEDSVIMMKQSFFDLLFSIKQGVVVPAGDLPQRILIGGGISEDGRMLGRNIRGIYSSVYIKVVPDSYWRQAAAYAGITSDTYAQFDKVQAFIANSVGTGFGRSLTDINPIPNPGNSIGTKIQTLFQWGSAITRPASIGMIVSTENNLTDFVNPIGQDGRAVVAPADFNETIKSYGFSNANYGNNASVGVYDSAKVSVITLTVQTDGSSPINNASLVVTKTASGENIGYTNNADGTYTIIVPRSTELSISVSAVGYTTSSVSVSTSNTATATYATTTQLATAAAAAATSMASAKSSTSTKSSTSETFES